MEITDPASAPTFSFPFVLDCQEFCVLTLSRAKGDSRVMLGFTSRYWVHWDAKPKRSGRDIRFYVSVEKDVT